MFSIVLFVICIYLSVWLCFPNLLCCARKFGKGVLLLCSLELAQCRLWVRSDCNFVTSVVPTLFGCIALFYFFILLFFFCFALFVRMRLGCFASAEATTGFALWIPTTFEKVDETLSVWVCLVLTTAAACYLPICGKLNAAAPPKKTKNCRKI